LSDDRRHVPAVALQLSTARKYFFAHNIVRRPCTPSSWSSFQRTAPYYLARRLLYHGCRLTRVGAKKLATCPGLS